MGLNNTPRMYNKAVSDLEKIIAQETSGMVEAIPEADDRDLAEVFLMMINNDARHVTRPEEFKDRIRKELDRMIMDFEARVS